MTPFVRDPDFTLWQGDVLEVLRQLPDESVDCCVTSPPYWGLRDYGIEGQIGLEPTPAEFVQRMVDVFREVRRVLAPHGTCWVNLGDSYASSGRSDRKESPGVTDTGEIKPKDLVGIPWRVAFALQDNGWWLRSDIVWSKPNPMPESVTDRPTKAHEYVFLLTKQPRYWFDQEAVREPSEFRKPWVSGTPNVPGRSVPGTFAGYHPSGRNVRSVWEIATQPYAEAHFATFPQELPRRCIKAGCPEWVCRTCGKPRERTVSVAYDWYREPRDDRNFSETSGYMGKRGHARKQVTTVGWSDCGHDNYRAGVVLDPFMGSGTTALVARELGRHSVGIELNPDYCRLAARRLSQLSLLAEGDAA